MKQLNQRQNYFDNSFIKISYAQYLQITSLIQNTTTCNMILIQIIICLSTELIY
ncbi:hypothetical protein pb186bvf_014254 [Paramecium bursaria]